MTDEFIVYKPKKSTLAEGRITFRGCDGKHGAVGNSFAVWGDSPRFWGILATGVATEATNAARTKPKVGRNQHRLRVESLLSLLIWLVIFYMRQSKVTIRFFVGDFHPSRSLGFLQISKVGLFAYLFTNQSIPSPQYFIPRYPPVVFVSNLFILSGHNFAKILPEGSDDIRGSDFTRYYLLHYFKTIP